jgi:hypothetical protein
VAAAVGDVPRRSPQPATQDGRCQGDAQDVERDECPGETRQERGLPPLQDQRADRVGDEGQRVELPRLRRALRRPRTRRPARTDRRDRRTRRSQAVALQRRVNRLALVNLGVLLSTVWAMVAKPSW